MYLTTNPDDRNSATGFRMICEVIGVLLSAGIPGIMITIYGSMNACETLNSTFTDVTPLITTKNLEYSKMVKINLFSKTFKKIQL